MCNYSTFFTHAQHEYAEIVEWYDNLAQEFPLLMTYNPSIGETFEGRSMPSVHFTGTENIPDKKKFYMQCQIHASEYPRNDVTLAKVGWLELQG